MVTMTGVATLVLIALLAVAIILNTPGNTAARVLAGIVGVIALVLIIIALV
jgi:hypothetical protein